MQDCLVTAQSSPYTEKLIGKHRYVFPELNKTWLEASAAGMLLTGNEAAKCKALG